MVFRKSSSSNSILLCGNRNQAIQFCFAEVVIKQFRGSDNWFYRQEGQKHDVHGAVQCGLEILIFAYFMITRVFLIISTKGGELLNSVIKCINKEKQWC